MYTWASDKPFENVQQELFEMLLWQLSSPVRSVSTIHLLRFTTYHSKDEKKIRYVSEGLGSIMSDQARFEKTEFFGKQVWNKSLILII